MPKRGFTLIEVVIALVIFVVGALAVIRIFPPTFNAVQNSSYRNIATRMADSIVNQMSGEKSTPDAVFDVQYDDTNTNGVPDWLEGTNRNSVELFWEDQDGAVEGTATINASLPTGPTAEAYQASALSHFRFVRGESAVVQNKSGSGLEPDGSASADNHPYLLTNFPYTAAANGGVRLFVNHEIKGVTIDEDGRLDFSRANLKDAANVGRPPEIIVSNTDTSNPDDNYTVQVFRSIVPVMGGYEDTGARFYISYRYVDGITHKVNSVIDEPIAFPSNDEWNAKAGGGNEDVNYVLQGLLRKRLLLNKPVIVPGSVRVTAKGALYVVPQVSPPVTPTLATIASGQTPVTPLGTNQQEGDAGYVPIPVAYTKADFTDSGGGSVTAYYSAFPGDSRVSVDYLVPDWRILFDQQTRAGNRVVLPVNVLPEFLPKGVAVDRTSNYVPVDGAFNAASTEKRTVTFASSYPVIRTAYKALDQWATQIAPAAQSYVPFVENGAIDNFRTHVGNSEVYYLPREPWREYFWAAGDNMVYFHASEAGKSVKVQFVPVGATQPIDQVLTISKAIVANPALATFAPSGFVTELVLTDSSGNPVNADSILGVTGMSVMARTAWLAGRSYNQAVSVGYR